MKTASVVRHGTEQYIRFPEDFRIDADTLYIKKVGNVVVLLPENSPWESLFSSLDLFTDDFMTDREQPRFQDREELFA
jgi:antitoxin VapB